MKTEEKDCYIKLLKLLRKHHKNKELKEIVHLIDHNGVQRICRCLSNIIYQQDIGLVKDKKQAKKLQRLIRKHQEEVESLVQYSPKKQVVEEKRRILPYTTI